MKYRTAPVRSDKMPTGLPYIISNEAAERFSFYGMKAILVVFMADYLFLMGDRVGSPMSQSAANEKNHLFVSAVYFTPLLGALLCDVFLGKYRTIILLSFVYCAGHAALAFMGTVGDPTTWLFMGLGLIALGAGGIKPCVSAHVGDQFGKSNSHLLPRAFNFFYFSINLGAFISGALTPWVLYYFGPHWAFGIPGALMALATLFFWMGRNSFIHVPAKGIGFIKEMFSGVGLRALAKLSIIYVFVAVFWALFDQTSSSWVFQVKDMDRNWMGITWLPSQVNAVNAVCILLFIPLFTFVIYPKVDKIFKLTPIRKISIGLFVMVVGFGIVALAQEWIDDGQKVSVGWQILAIAVVTMAEVMVSIVALEFSYTQAPNAMKSMVMAFFLCSVSLGNIFTAGVNHFIQIEDPLDSYDLKESAKKAAGSDEGGVTLEGSIATIAGFDGKMGTGDDLKILYNDVGERRAVDFPGRLVLEGAVSRIEKAALAAGTAEDPVLPSEIEGQKLLEGIEDPWGNTIVYHLISWRRFRVSSPGPDSEHKSKWDIGYVVTRSDPKKEKGERKSWLELFKEEQAIEKEEEEPLDEMFATLEEHEVAAGFDREKFIGGRVTLEGAPYFWFFTRLMLAAAALFVVVAFFYRPKTYLQDEEPDAETKAEEDLGARGVIS